MKNFMTVLICTLVLLLMQGCSISNTMKGIALDPSEKGAACIYGSAEAVNPLVNGGTAGGVIEVNTGTDEPVTIDQLVQLAEAMGCAEMVRGR